MNKEDLDNLSQQVSEDHEETMEFTPFTLAGESNDTTQTYSPFEREIENDGKKSLWSRILKIFIAAIVIIAVITVAFLTNMQSNNRKDAIDSIDDFNQSILSLKSITDNNNTLIGDISEYANSQETGDNQENAVNLSNLLRASSEESYTEITESMNNEEAGTSVAVYYAICDLSATEAVSEIDTNSTNSLVESCSTVTDSAFTMMNNISSYNKMQDSFVSKISLHSGGKLPDVTID